MIRFFWLILATCSLSGDVYSQTVSSPTLEPTLVRLGAVGHRDERRVEFTITNPGATPLVFTKVYPSCSCMKVEFDSKPIPAGESRNGAVVISFGRGFGNFNKHVDFSIQGKRTPLALHIFANFHPGVRCDSLELVLDGFEGAKDPSARTVLEIKSVIPKGPPPTVTDLKWGRGGEKLTAKFLEPGRDRVRIEVAFAADHPEGPISGELNALVNGRLLVMPVRGNVYRGIRLQPAIVNFNVIREASDTIERIELIPAEGSNFEIVSTRYEPRARSSELTPEIEKKPREGGGWILTLTIEPTDGVKGGFGGKLIVATDHPEKPEVTLTVFGHIP